MDDEPVECTDWPAPGSLAKPIGLALRMDRLPGRHPESSRRREPAAGFVKSARTASLMDGCRPC